MPDFYADDDTFAAQLDEMPEAEWAAWGGMIEAAERDAFGWDDDGPAPVRVGGEYFYL